LIVAEVLHVGRSDEGGAVSHLEQFMEKADTAETRKVVLGNCYRVMSTTSGKRPRRNSFEEQRL